MKRASVALPSGGINRKTSPSNRYSPLLAATQSSPSARSQMPKTLSVGCCRIVPSGVSMLHDFSAGRASSPCKGTTFHAPPAKRITPFSPDTHTLPCRSRRMPCRRFGLFAGKACCATATNSTPSKRTICRGVVNHTKPSGNWVIDVTRPSGRPSSTPQYLTV